MRHIILFPFLVVFPVLLAADQLLAALAQVVVQLLVNKAAR